MNGLSPLACVEEMVFQVIGDPVADQLRIAPKTVGSPVPQAGGLPPVVPQTFDFSRRNHPVRRVSDQQPTVVSRRRSDDDGRRETVRQDRMTKLHDDVPKPSTTALA